MWPAPTIVNSSAPSDSASLVAASWEKGHDRKADAEQTGHREVLPSKGRTESDGQRHV